MKWNTLLQNDFEAEILVPKQVLFSCYILEHIYSNLQIHVNVDSMKLLWL